LANALRRVWRHPQLQNSRIHRAGTSLRSFIRDRAIIDCNSNIWNIGGAGPQFKRASSPSYRTCRAAPWDSGKPYMYFLVPRFSSAQPIRDWKRQWPAIGLERGIAPISLVLHFKNLALECYLGVDSIYAIAQACYSGCNLPRRNHQGETGTRHGAVRMDDAQECSDNIPQRMKQGETGAIGHKFAACRQLGCCDEGPVRMYLECEIDAKRAACNQADLKDFKLVRRLRDLFISQYRGISSPVRIPNRTGDAANDFCSMPRKSTDSPVRENQRQRARRNFSLGLERLVSAEINHVVG